MAVTKHFGKNNFDNHSKVYVLDGTQRRPEATKSKLDCFKRSEWFWMTLSIMSSITCTVSLFGFALNKRVEVITATGELKI